MLNIKKTINGSELDVALEGRLDTLTAPTLESELEASVEGIDKLVMDFADLKYISSAGLRVLLTAPQQMEDRGGLLVKNIAPDIKEILDVTGFSDILNIE